MKRTKQNVKQIEYFFLSTIEEMAHLKERYLFASNVIGEMQADPPAYYKELTNYDFDSIAGHIERIILYFIKDRKMDYEDFIEQLENYITYIVLKPKQLADTLKSWGVDAEVINNEVIVNERK